MQAPLRPAHPVPGFADSRLPSTNDGQGRLFYPGCIPLSFSPSPRPSPLATPFTPSPRSPTSSSSSSGTLLDDAGGDDAVATEHRAVLHYKTARNDHHDRCVALLTDAAREADALRLQNEKLREVNCDLACRFARLGNDQAASSLLLLGQMPATPAGKHARMPKSISIRRSTGSGGGHAKGLLTNDIVTGCRRRRVPRSCEAVLR
ncbi:zinc finger CCCH domain-containing protein 39 [Triticum aestivum]|uniref:zinc finger CCCH domain-containing protein 39 n=1 Tax=Triticum aestivum TaxID=4565 RepID=UPI0008435F6C|nr:zinc finger CCCH domain-containing protein 39-like [Triticum aestivum]XP_044384184.1 zinc finger CCCH domain-containing protein 39-like [Triticum aestivum]